MKSTRVGWWLLPLSLAACQPRGEAPAEPMAEPAAQEIGASAEAENGALLGGDAIEVNDLWVRAMPPAAPVAAGYLSLTNTSTVDVRLLAVESPMASVVEIHDMSEVDGMMQMRHLAEGLLIAAGETVQLKPGGMHLMLMDPTATLQPGDTVPMTFRFAEGPEVTLNAPVRTAAETTDDNAHAHH